MEIQNYKWNQKFKELEIIFRIDTAPINGKNIAFRSSGDHLKVTYEGKVLFDAKLLQNIEADETFWFIEEGLLRFELVKKKSEWWESLTEGGEKVDIAALADENVVNDLSLLAPEERSMVEKMMSGSRKE